LYYCEKKTTTWIPSKIDITHKCITHFKLIRTTPPQSTSCVHQTTDIEILSHCNHTAICWSSRKEQKLWKGGKIK